MNRPRALRLVFSATTIVVVMGGVAIYFAGRRPAAENPSNKIAGPDDQPKESMAARAAAGDSRSQLQMGLSELENAKRPADYLQAAEWLHKAAESGNSEAQYRLGTLYHTGRGIPRDETNAFGWFQKAAVQQHIAALYNLGSMYEAGQGVAADSKVAARFMERAAELADPYAQYNMARRYEDGHGVAPNLVEACKWYGLADAGGIAGARNARRALEARLASKEKRQVRQAIADFKNRSSARQAEKGG